ncbi:MAG: hypothetical protein ACR2O6_10500 [Ilumatobacteraceae bacterium]
MSNDNTNPSDEDLLSAYEPVVRFTEGELFFPASVDEYVAGCQLLEHVPGGRPEVRLNRGEVTLEGLGELGAAHPAPGQFLRFVSEPFSRTEQLRWRRRSDRPRFRTAGRLARVGVLSRVVDALLRLSLFFRGGVAKGTEAAAETQYREQMRTDHHPYYGRVVRGGGYVALQYWYFYAFNDWRSRAYGVNDHEADWEQVVVYLAEQPDGSARPTWVVFSAHDETGDDLRRRWDDPDMTLVGDHPVVNAGLGSHSGAYLAGEYLTTFEAPAFHGLIRFFRSISRLLLPWTRDQEQSGVGIPYVDYSRGDGLSIGPGQDREWTPVVIDDQTPWVFDYRGLWGNDTEDPFGGERAPAGPRYERSGEVRPSWGDLVGWSGLAKVAPNREVGEQLVLRRLEEVRTEESIVRSEVDDLRTKLRADVASGIAVTPADEGELADRVAHGVDLHDERRRLDARLAKPPPTPGPHDHLHHRRLPAPNEPRGRRRFLAIWSAVSTPLILALIGLAFLPRGDLTVLGSVFIGFLLVFVIEAIARGNLFRFLATLVTLVALFVVGTTVAGLTVFFGWQTTVATCFFALAIVLLLNNLRELSSD